MPLTWKVMVEEVYSSNCSIVDTASFAMRTLKSNGVLLPMKAVNVIFPMDRQTTDLMPDRKKKLQQKKAQTVQLKFMSRQLKRIQILQQKQQPMHRCRNRQSRKAKNYILLQTIRKLL